MSSICKMDCCHQCDRQKDCGGCTKTDGHPFGGRCVAAECIKQEGIEAFFRLKDSLIAEINSLGIPYGLRKAWDDTCVREIFASK